MLCNFASSVITALAGPEPMPFVDVVAKSDSAWSSTEVETVLAVRKALVETKGLSPTDIGEIELITVTLNSKLRVDEAVNKYLTYRNELLAEYGIDNVWADPSVDGMDQQWHRLLVAGRDEENRQIMWIHGTPDGTPVAEERPCIRACCQYCMPAAARVANCACCLSDPGAIARSRFRSLCRARR